MIGRSSGSPGHSGAVEPGAADQQKSLRGFRARLIPSPNDLVFLFAFFAALALGTALTSRDGDLGRHLRIAEWMLDNRALPLSDVFSHTRAGSSVVVHEWLSQLALGITHRAAGFNGIGLLTSILVSAPWAMLSRSLLRRGFAVSTVIPLCLLGSLASVVHWAARPHVFTFVFVAYWSIALADYEEQRRKSVYAIAPLTLIWANMHGAFIVGFVLLGMYLLAAVLDRHQNRIRHLSLVLGLSIAASLANPNGLRLITNSFAYIGDDFLLSFTTEYNSPDFHLKGFWPFLVLLLLAVVLPLPPRNSARILFVGWAAFALYSFRNVPLFAIIAVPFLAEAVESALQTRPGFLLRVRARLAAWGEPWRQTNRTLIGGALSLVAVITMGLVLGSAERESRFFFRQDLFPVETMDALGSSAPGDRVFNQFAWGGYLLYCCWPDVEVFIDGQTDFYGPDLTREYEQTVTGQPGWNDVLATYEIDWILIPPDAPLAQILSESPAWQELRRDATAVVFVRGF